MQEITLTPEEIARNYTSTLDSVNLIAELKAKAELNEEELAILARNVEHVNLMLAKTYWTTEDLAPLQAAVI